MRKNRHNPEDIKITNIMADGSICEDLSTYWDTHPMPEAAQRLIYEFIMDGYEMRKRQEQKGNIPLPE